MKFNRRSILPCFAITVLLLSGCGGAPTLNSPSGSLTVELVSPRTPTVVWPKFLYILAAEVNDNASGTTSTGNQPVHVVFYANGQTVGSVDAPVGAQATLKWTPPAAGQYTIQAEVQANGTIVSSKLVQMCVLNIDMSQGTRLWGYGYNGSCALPPAGAAQGTIKFTPSAEPSSLTYNYNCSSKIGPAVIKFQVKVNDPGNRVAFVNVKYVAQGYNFKTPTVVDGESETSFFDSIMLNQTSAAPDGTKTFSGTTEDLGPISEALLAGANGEIQWSARAISSIGTGTKQLLVEDGPHAIPIGPCTPPAIAP